VLLTPCRAGNVVVNQENQALRHVASAARLLAAGRRGLQTGRARAHFHEPHGVVVALNAEFVLTDTENHAIHDG